MKILEYDGVDPVGVLNLTMLGLDFQLTTERAAHIRRTDPRPFPFLALYAVEDDIVLGQVGVFRLPMISVEGREDVGGVWAVSTHPQYTGLGIASRLLEEAHERMRNAGLRFSTLGTNRFRGAYRLYLRHGYSDLHVWATAFARWETAHQPTRLRAEPAVTKGYGYIEALFENTARDYLGFSWRYKPFARLRDLISTGDIWILLENENPIGYALANVNKDILNISSLLMRPDVDAAEAVAAIVARLKTAFVQVAVSRPKEISSLQYAGYRVAYPNWDAFMIKPLTPAVTLDDARQLFGIGTDRFLISWLDTT